MLRKLKIILFVGLLSFLSANFSPLFAADEAPAASPRYTRLAELPPEVLNKLTTDDITRILRKESEDQKPQTVAELAFNQNILVPVAIFGSFALIMFIFAYFSYRKRRDVMLTVQAAIQSGQTLPDSFIASLEKSRRTPAPEADLRRAVLLIAIGLSAIAILLALGPIEGQKFAAIGILPTLLGAAYLFLWKLAQNKSKNG